jgi:putative CocE/NonD family hydrolase
MPARVTPVDPDSEMSTPTAFGGLELAKPEPRFAFDIDEHVRVPMRDGSVLAADLYLPVGAQQPLGTVLIRTPYDRREWRPGGASEGWDPTTLFVEQGFALLIQDVRGKWGSEGEFHVYRAERNDGFDTVEWIVSQPWSNGRVGTFGCSYLGEVQLLLAATGHPAHVAAVPQGGAGCTAAEMGFRIGGASNLMDAIGWFSCHGACDLSSMEPGVAIDGAVWQLPIVDAIAANGGPRSDYERVVASEPGDSWWLEETGLMTHHDRFDVPALWIDAWYDRADTTFAFADRLRRESRSERSRRNQFVLIAPCAHCAMHLAGVDTRVGALRVGDARFPYDALYVAWFRHWLEDPDPGDFDWAPFTYYTIGRGEWRTSETWPPRANPADALELALTSDGAAAEPGRAGELATAPPARDTTDTYIYDPADPCPSLGGVAIIDYPEVGTGGASDQGPLRLRPDVATYLGPLLEAPAEVNGAPELLVHVSSDAPDTDLVVKLLDVLEDGRCWNVAQTILRLRYRHSLRSPQMMKPGVVYPVQVELPPVSYRFRPGSRIGLMLTSSDFPAYDRNLNGPGVPALATTPVPARNSIHHGPSWPSRLVLPGARADPDAP